MFDISWSCVTTIVKESYYILETEVARSFGCWDNNDWVLILSHELFEQTEFSSLAVKLNFGESDLMFVSIDITAA